MALPHSNAPDRRRFGAAPSGLPAISLLAVLVTAASGAAGAAKAPADLEGAPAGPDHAPVDFNRDIRPLLSDNCFACHGPDDKKRKAKLRLDRREGAFADLGGRSAVVAGNPGRSELYRRITAGDPDERMPPPETGKTLTPAQTETVRRWIAAGAEYQEHWSFVPPSRRRPPPVLDTAWPRNALDRFILARLEAAGLRPSPEADRPTLLRRLHLDLTGLPPPPAEVDAFVADRRPGAVERAVDRLLASPAYGERMGRHWLDLARYADSNGYANDNVRSIWPYRDWVVGALNRDLPFDRFTLEQLAGDLLPGVAEDPARLVATGFHRNTPHQTEGGSDPEQYRVERVKNRTDTTGTVWLGLTVGCAQCHTHKFDPVTHAEYYRLYAFFNSTDEPQLKVPEPDQAEEVAAAAAALETARRTLSEWDAGLAAAVGRARSGEEVPVTAEVRWQTLLPARVESRGGATLTRLDDGSLLAGGANPARDTYVIEAAAPLAGLPRPPTALRLEALTHPSLPKNGPGRAANGNFVVALLTVTAGGRPVPLARAYADHSQPGYLVAHAIDGNPSTGWAINVRGGSGRVLNVDREAVFVFAAPAEPTPGETLRIEFTTYDQGGGSGYNVGRFRLGLTGDPAGALRPPGRLEAALAKAPQAWDDGDRAALADAFLPADEARRRSALAAEVTRLQGRVKALEKGAPTTLVTRERKSPRPSFVHLRGDFLDPGEAVAPGTFSVLHPLRPESPDRGGGTNGNATDTPPANRLDLARWLVRADNPLTPRVVANRAWQKFFGRGLVRTEEDFGYQGALPTHPGLLDHLALELVEGGWSLKRLHRLIVTSATYRQSSRGRTDLVAADPANHRLGRQSRHRVEGEVVRDLALAASGRLSHRLGGPPVFPPIPGGVIGTSSARHKWPLSRGEDRFRRGLYTAIYRANVYPLFSTFDGPDRDNACTRRTRSNTPVQALTIANDTVFLGAARAAARRVLREVGERSGETGADVTAARVHHAFRLTLSRPPSPAEERRLADFVRQQFGRYTTDADAASALAGTLPLPPGATTAQAATWTAALRVLFNLDEFITRE